MESSHYSNGMPYYGDSTNSGNAGGRHSYPSQQNHQSAFHASLPNLQASQQYEQTTLPPLQSQPRPPAGTSQGLYEHYHRSHQPTGFPSAATSQLSYGGPSAPFGGQFANYSHSDLLPQQHQSYQMQHDPASTGYMSNTGFGLTSPLPPPLPSSQAYGAPFASAYDQNPGHVVGAQGRRGILPSDDGRPSAVAADGSTAPRSNVMPVKDSEGKYPCPHCNKSYLHAKHLKRHLLRHTGDRPYSCFLCNDTFSRSDILKRHFQKCSIRRGNPTGASHLQNSQAHLRKQAAKRSSNDLGKAETKSLPDSDANSIASASTSRPASDNFSSIRSDGRTDSGISTKSSLISRDSRSLTAPQPLTPMKQEQGSYTMKQEQGSYNGQPVNLALPSTSGQNVAYMVGSIGTHGFRPNETIPEIQNNNGDYDWARTQPSTHPVTPTNGSDFIHPYYDVVSPGGHDILAQDYSYEASWEPPPFQQNAVSFHKVSHQLISFLNIEHAQDEESELIRKILLPENIEHLLAKYQNFHAHWPHVHLQSFNPSTSYPGLTLAMVTIGAVYSDRIDASQVRVLMNRTKLHIREVSDVGKAARDPTVDVTLLSDSVEVYEQVVALSLLTTLILWHADPEQRQMLNSDHPGLCNLLKRMGMLRPLSRASPGYSELHQPDLDEKLVAGFNYEAWLRQEKRSRALYITLLADMGQFLYFSTRPNFLAEEIEVPLPSDDAAWEAVDGQQCATSLGLHGQEAQETANVSGSRLLRQQGFSVAMAKLALGEEFEPRSTNAFGRFLLVHGIHIRIWFAQQQRALPRATLDNESPQTVDQPDNGALSHLEQELNNWRRLADREDVVQYPPSAPPRLGFCRDGKTYLLLGLMLIKSPSLFRPNVHWQHRFRVMVKALKQAKAYSANEPRPDGALLMLSSDTVDPAYGVDDLTLDMKLLFTPLTPDGSPAPTGVTFQSLDSHPTPGN